MKFVSPLLKHVVYPSVSGTGILRRYTREIPTVITYHGVFPADYHVDGENCDENLVSADMLRRQLVFLKKNYNVIHPEEFRSWCVSQKQLPPRSVLLTCDDGLRNVVTDMLPVLQEQSLACLFFVTGASLGDVAEMLWYEELFLMLSSSAKSAKLTIPEIGLESRPLEETNNLWRELVEKFSQFNAAERATLKEKVRVQLDLSKNWNANYLEDAVLRNRFCLLNIDGLKQLKASGMCIGSHTLSHPALSRQSMENARTEIVDCRRFLEDTLECPIWAMAYPFGDAASVGEREFEMAARAGFECAFVNVENARHELSLMAYPRVHVTRNMSLAEFDAHVSGFYQSVRNFFHPNERSQVQALVNP